MVLGLLTGSMPMLVSLLFMQGITLTMWRSFLDKAIPNLNNDKLRRGFQQMMPTTAQSANSLQSIPQSPSSTDQFSTPSTSSSSMIMDQSSNNGNSITNSLQLLANLDPRIVQLLAQVSGGGGQTQPSQQQSNSITQTTAPSPLSSPIDQMNILNSLTTLLRSSAPSSMSMPQSNQQIPLSLLLQNSQPMQQQYQYLQQQQQQYTPIIDPNNPNIKYYEVSSSNPPGQIDGQIIQYEQQQPYDIDGENLKYDHIESHDDDDDTKTMKKSSSKQPSTIQDDEPEEEYDDHDDEEMDEKRKNSDLYEEVDYVDDGNEAEETTGDDEPEEDYDELENESDTVKSSIRDRISPKRMFTATKNKIQMFRHHHRISKRMIRLDLSPLQTKLKEKFKNAFPFLRRNSNPVHNDRKPGINKKKIESKKIHYKNNNNNNGRKLSTSSSTQNRQQKPLPYQQSWRRTTDQHKDNFRFATPKIPILPDDDNDDDDDDDKQDIVKKEEKPRKNIKKSTTKKKQVKKTKTKTKIISLPPKKISISSDIDEFEANFCNVTLNKIKTNKKFGEIWSKKNGWSRCHPKSPSFRISKGIVIPAINIESPVDLSTTTTSPDDDIDESTTTLPVNEEKEGDDDNDVADLELTTTEISELETTTATTTTTTTLESNEMTTEQDIDDETTISTTVATTQLTFPINSDFFINFNNFLATLGSSSTTTTMSPIFFSASPPSTTTTTTTAMAPTQTWNHVDEIPKEFLFKRVCYLLLNGGKDGGNIEINQLELHICSHLIVGYARIATNGLVVAQKPLEDGERYRLATMMKIQYPKLKVMLSIGDLGGTMFSIVTSTNRTRERFIISILDICTEFNFDGIDIDWEFPGFRTPGLSRDKQNLVQFLKELRQMSKLIWPNDINNNNNRGSSSSFLISLAVGAPLMIASTSYLIPEIEKFVDFVNLMSYDFHYYRPDKPYTGHHAPLYPRSTDNAYFSTLNVAWTATYWANSGMPLRKIMIGVPTYARTYNLVVPIVQNMINLPASGPGIGKGKLNYTRVCEFLRLPGTVKQFDFHSQVPYAYNGFDWVSYENELSVATKAQWVVKTGMGGIVTFALNFDDTKGICRDDGKRFPLQKTISNVLELAAIKSYKKSLHVPFQFRNHDNNNRD
ncbi:chitinase-like protein 3 [Dermatophagoides farinae]|uniref:Chitinase-like protein 3 n=1 Tax=Dermatophagoides farinae TaxID=6954 RepID=A0A9D4P391_DERFA|nr:chitinase-like protein 3 [Dermatophagoides farinae]